MNCKKCKGKGYTKPKTDVILNIPIFGGFILGPIAAVFQIGIKRKEGKVVHPEKCKKCNGTGKEG